MFVLNFQLLLDVVEIVQAKVHAWPAQNLQTRIRVTRYNQAGRSHQYDLRVLRTRHHVGSRFGNFLLFQRLGLIDFPLKFNRETINKASENGRCKSARFRQI